MKIRLEDNGQPIADIEVEALPRRDDTITVRYAGNGPNAPPASLTCDVLGVDHFADDRGKPPADAEPARIVVRVRARIKV